MRTTRQDFAVSRFYRDRKLIQLNPEYQREGGVWSLAKRQLFIDSLINGYDIPKLYMHKLDRDETGHDFAVIDGKQRIGTIYEFLTDQFRLADDFSYTRESELGAPPQRGQTYSEFAPDSRDLVKECSLDVVVVETKDIDDIEELFSRLNNGEKLNAAESRNAVGGNMAALIRDAAKHEFFEQKLGFANKRFAHYEVCCKLLYLEKEAAKSPKKLVVVDLKKKFLDDFVRQYADISSSDAERLAQRLSDNLKMIAPIFDDNDIELSKQSYPQLMYVFTTWILRQYAAPDLKGLLKTFLRDFRIERRLNLEKDEDSRDAELSEFGRLMQQGTNDAGSMEQRVNIMTKRFLRANQIVVLKDPRRAFSTEERWALWQRSGKRCEGCEKDLPSLDDLDGDHIILHIEGGPTSLENARALCVTCNRGANNALHPSPTP